MTHYLMLLVTLYAVAGCLAVCAAVYWSPIDPHQ
jgi:hypothetical protein